MNASQLTQLNLQAPSQQNHHVARCQWQTHYDGDRQGAWQLQEVLSHWTNNVLKNLLEQLFNRYCPQGYTWRIDQITLDLGVIDYNELVTELPKRVEDALTLQLQRLLQFAQWNAQTDIFSASHLPAAYAMPEDIYKKHASQLLDSDNTLQAFVQHYLRAGTVPWWYRGPLSHQQVLHTQLVNSPTQVAVMIRQLGRIESVRKRLVWQYYPQPLNLLIKAIEPYHHEVIEQFADSLIDLQQQQQQQLGGDHAAVARQSWYWILTHLLVERGSLFNTTAFVVSTLQQMAHHHQLDYAHLLGQMLQVAQSLKQNHSQVPVFIQALLAAEQQLMVPVVNKHNKYASFKYTTSLKISDMEITDLWQQFEHRLQGKTISNNNVVNHLLEMFAVLARQNAHQMAALLRRVGHNETVRERIIKAFGEAELAAVVVVLVPDDHAFVLSHLRHTKKVLSAKSFSSNSLSVWHVVLAYLLKNSGSYFNRRQFVTHTLRYWSQARGLDYGLLLDLLSSVPLDYRGSVQRFELLTILTDLKQLHYISMGQKKAYKQAGGNDQISRYHQCLYRYLSHGQIAMGDQIEQSNSEAVPLPAPQVLLSLLLYRDPEGLVTLLREGWVKSHCSQRWLSRLMSILSLADIPVLFRALAPDVADWLLSLLALDGEQGDEVGLMMLLSHPVEALSITNILNRLKILSPVLITRLQQSLNRGSEQALKYPARVLSSEIRSSVLAWFKKQSAQSIGLHHSAEIEQIIRLLRQASSTQLRSVSAGLSQRLKQCLPGDGDALLSALQRQPQSSRLAHTLLQQMPEVPALEVWLVTLHPKNLMPVRPLLSLLSQRLQNSGLWQGSVTRLEQLLARQLWLTVLTQAVAASVNTDEFWRHLIFGLSRPLALSTRQLFMAFTNMSLTGNDGKTFEVVEQSDVITQAIRAALSIDVCLVEQNQTIFCADKKLNEGCENSNQSNHLAALNKPWVIDAAGHYLQQPAMVQVLAHWLRYGRVPLWWMSIPNLSLAALLTDVLTFAPSLLVTVLRQIQTQNRADGYSVVLRRLANQIDFSALMLLIGRTEPALASKLSALANIDKALQAGLLNHINPALDDLLRLLLWQYTVQAWLGGSSSHWQALMPQAAISYLYVQLIDRYPGAKNAVSDAFAETFTATFEVPQTRSETVQKKLDHLLPALPATASDDVSKQFKEQPVTMPIAVSNAGLVIIHDFIKNYFSKLELIGEDGFVCEQAQLDAVHWLQFLVTGHQSTDETHLVLNKVLCGLPLSTPVATGIEISKEQQQLAEGLIDAVIEYWSAIGSSSIEGFRGNWLVRDGLLSETEEHWELVVEKRPYDLLLERLPFGFSLIRLPWMDKPLYVTWPT